MQTVDNSNMSTVNENRTSVLMERSAQGKALHLVVMDPSVENYQILLDSLPVDTPVLVLGAYKQGLEEIAAFVQGFESIDSIHVISHGAPGTLFLGSSVITLDTLHHFESELSLIGESLNDGASILLYGCEVAKCGSQLIERIADLTGADVAASLGLVGRITGQGSVQGSDWSLNARTNPEMTVELIFPQDTRNAYHGTLSSLYTRSSPETLVEGGVSTSFDLALNVRPTADVVVSVSLSEGIHVRLLS
jgi:hypothetical protein